VLPLYAVTSDNITFFNVAKTVLKVLVPVVVGFVGGGVANVRRRGLSGTCKVCGVSFRVPQHAFTC
jgi:hypothetical protein